MTRDTRDTRVLKQIWWCARCQQLYRTPLPATEVRCKKGHRMKYLESEAEIAREKAQEGAK
jgi:hypothetical protein